MLTLAPSVNKLTIVLVLSCFWFEIIPLPRLDPDMIIGSILSGLIPVISVTAIGSAAVTASTD